MDSVKQSMVVLTGPLGSSRILANTQQLDCGNMLYVGLPLESVQKLQQVQNTVARVLTGADYTDHITPMLQQ